MNDRNLKTSKNLNKSKQRPEAATKHRKCSDENAKGKFHNKATKAAKT